MATTTLEVFMPSTWWMAPDTPWYVPYLIWLGVIVMTGVVQLWRGRHDI